MASEIGLTKAGIAKDRLVDMSSRSKTVLVLLSLAVAMAACADESPDKADIADKLRADPQTSGAPEEAVDCIANWYETYATPEQRAAFLGDNAPDLDVIASAAGPVAERAMLACLKLAVTVG